MPGVLQVRRGSTGITLDSGEFYLNADVNSVQIGSGSSILTLLPINKYITGDILLNGNVYANNLTGSAALSGSITANQTIGGINSGDVFALGTDLNTIVNDLLIKYIPAITSDLVIFNASTPISNASREVGANFTFNKFVYSSSVDSPGGAYAISGSVTMSGATNGTDFTLAGPNPLSSNVTITLGSTVTPTRNTTGSIVFTVNAKTADNSMSITPLTLSYVYRYKNILAASATNVIDDASAQTVYDSSVDFELADTLNWIAECNSDNNDTTKYTYIIYPSGYSDITQISKNGNDVTNAFTKLSGTYNITNANLITTSYKIYKSTQPGAYRSGDKLTIS